jgi:hypothetical protein
MPPKLAFLNADETTAIGLRLMRCFLTLRSSPNGWSKKKRNCRQSLPTDARLSAPGQPLSGPADHRSRAAPEMTSNLALSNSRPTIKLIVDNL